MAVDIVLGCQWGDEGKAKMVDAMAQRYDIVARFQGGANAGHTVLHEGEKFVFHLIPSGILFDHTICVMGSGMTIHPETLIDEIQQLKEKGINFESRLIISENAFVVMPYHIHLDTCREEYNTKTIGSTRRGIAPTYEDKICRRGIRIGDLGNKEILQEKIEIAMAEKDIVNKYLFNKPFSFSAHGIKEIVNTYHESYQKMLPYIGNTVYALNEAAENGKNILLEGAQGTGLDIDFGTYPYVTSSNCSTGGAFTGTGLSPKHLQNITGIFKAYITRVGEGVLPTQLAAEEMENLINVGNEFGATTGRKRRCGWLDLVQAKFAVMINGITHLAITKADVLDTFKTIKVATAYEVDGVVTQKFSTDYKVLQKAKPVYKSFDGWQISTDGIKNYADLPNNFRKYMDFIQNYLNVPIKYISNGPSRKQLIVK